VKISAPALAPTAPVLTTRAVAPSAPIDGASATSPAASVQRSGFLTQLQEATRSAPYGEVRPDRVAEARADIVAGRLGTPADLDAAVAALLRDL
jgi:hypothetical protein